MQPEHSSTGFAPRRCATEGCREFLAVGAPKQVRYCERCRPRPKVSAGPPERECRLPGCTNRIPAHPRRPGRPRRYCTDHRTRKARRQWMYARGVSLTQQEILHARQEGR